MRPIQLLRVERITQRQRLDAKRLNGGETAEIPVSDIVGMSWVNCQTPSVAALLGGESRPGSQQFYTEVTKKPGKHAEADRGDDHARGNGSLKFMSLIMS